VLLGIFSKIMASTLRARINCGALLARSASLRDGSIPVLAFLSTTLIKGLFVTDSTIANNSKLKIDISLK